MKKILLVHTRYRITGGEDIAVDNEILALKKVYDVEALIFSNNEIDNIFKQIIYFLINKNSQSDKLLENKLNSFKPDMVYIHNTWFKASLGIFRLLKKHNTKFVIKLHNYRFECGRFFFKASHLKGNSFCSACGYHKTDTFLFNKYFKDSYIKSLLLIIYCKQYYKILKNSNVLTLSNFQKQYLINDGFEVKSYSISNIEGNDGLMLLLFVTVLQKGNDLYECQEYQTLDQNLDTLNMSLICKQLVQPYQRGVGT